MSNDAHEFDPDLDTGDVWLARGLLNDFVQSISAAVRQQSGFKTIPWCGYLRLGPEDLRPEVRGSRGAWDVAADNSNGIHEVRGACERPPGASLRGTPVFLLELIAGPELVVTY